MQRGATPDCRTTSPFQLAGSLAMIAMGVTECGQQDTSDWLIVDNRTDSRIVVTQILQYGNETVIDQVGEVGPTTQGYAGGKKSCAAQDLQARLGSIDGPVIDRRPAEEGENCVEVWVVGDD